MFRMWQDGCYECSVREKLQLRLPAAGAFHATLIKTESHRVFSGANEFIDFDTPTAINIRLQSVDIHICHLNS